MALKKKPTTRNGSTLVSKRAVSCEDVIRRVTEHRFENGRTGFTYLDGPPIVLAGKATPIPMSAPLEDAVVPTREEILATVRSLA